MTTGGDRLRFQTRSVKGAPQPPEPGFPASEQPERPLACRHRRCQPSRPERDCQQDRLRYRCSSNRNFISQCRYPPASPMGLTGRSRSRSSRCSIARRCHTEIRSERNCTNQGPTPSRSRNLRCSSHYSRYTRIGTRDNPYMCRCCSSLCSIRSSMCSRCDSAICIRRRDDRLRHTG